MKTYKELNRELRLENSVLRQDNTELSLIIKALKEQLANENLPNLFDHVKLNDRYELAMSGLNAIKEMTKNEPTTVAHVIATECLLQIEAIK